MVAALPGLLGENPTLAVETNFGFEILKNRSFLFMLLQILCFSKICLVSKIEKQEHFLLLPPYPKIYLDQEKLERDICTLCALDNPNCFNLNTKERRWDQKLTRPTF